MADYGDGTNPKAQLISFDGDNFHIYHSLIDFVNQSIQVTEQEYGTFWLHGALIIESSQKYTWSSDNTWLVKETLILGAVWSMSQPALTYNCGSPVFFDSLRE